MMPAEIVYGGWGYGYCSKCGGFITLDINNLPIGDTCKHIAKAYAGR